MKKKDKFFLIPILFSAFSTVSILFAIILFYGKLPARLPLFYSLVWGEGQLVPREQLFILPAVIVLVSLINLLIASQLHPMQHVLKRILTLNLILVDIIILVTVVNILMIFI